LSIQPEPRSMFGAAIFRVPNSSSVKGRAATILAFKAYVALVAASLHGAVNPRRGGYAERRARILPHGRAPSTALFDPRQPCRKYL
jgi:hypothetical protein